MPSIIMRSYVDRRLGMVINIAFYFESDNVVELVDKARKELKPDDQVATMSPFSATDMDLIDPGLLNTNLSDMLNSPVVVGVMGFNATREFWEKLKTTLVGDKRG
ncbi:MAG: hypothetical protein QW750_06265 [Zestosphaera sp.]